ncbi:MAG: hypothetical protein ACK5A1_07840 [Planctomyces sp.]
MVFLIARAMQRLRDATTSISRVGRPSKVPPLPVFAEFIGDCCVGKTTLLTMMQEFYIDKPLPSKLCLSMRADDPREAVREGQRAALLHKELSTEDGLASTVAERRTDYFLYAGDVAAAQLQVCDSVGQALTKVDSPADRSRLYERYHERLCRANVVWLVVRCPSDVSGDDPQLLNDIRLGQLYLRAALSAHAGTDQRVSVVILITRIDAVFDSAQRAQEALTESAIRKMLSPLIGMIEASEVLHSAVVIPVSAMGFATLTAQSGGSRATLRPGGRCQPFNVQGVMPWSILHGILPQETGLTVRQSEMRSRVITMLEADLRELNPWMCKIR